MLQACVCTYVYLNCKFDHLDVIWKLPEMLNVIAGFSCQITISIWKLNERDVCLHSFSRKWLQFISYSVLDYSAPQFKIFFSVQSKSNVVKSMENSCISHYLWTKIFHQNIDSEEAENIFRQIYLLFFSTLPPVNSWYWLGEYPAILILVEYNMCLLPVEILLQIR